MTIYKGRTPISGLAKNTIVNGFHIFDCKWADHLLEDISWLRADQFSYHSGNVYTSAYNELVSEYNNASSTTETDSDLAHPNFTRVGSPTIVNGVVSNFTISNYVKTDSVFSPATNTWEIVLKFNYVPNSNNQVIFDSNNGSLVTRPITCYINASGYIYYGLTSSTSSYTILSETAGATILTGGTTYYLKAEFTGSQYNFYISTTGEFSGEEILDKQVTSSTAILSGYPLVIGAFLPSSADFKGSIDLKESYIKINNSIWWQGYDHITFKRTPKGYKIADATQETAILNKYNNSGIAWYYILDTTNTQFKLPRTKFGFEGLRTSVGDDITESLPNITGGIHAGGIANYNYDDKITGTGAFYSTASSIISKNTTAGATDSSSLGFDASRSSSTYQDNAPVQERATQMYLYFYVGEYAQTAIEQTAGITSEQLNNKLDANHGNDTKPYLKTTYVNGTSGYRIWSDGYCEQWGNSTDTTTSGTLVTLAKTFSSTDYLILVGPLIGAAYGTASYGADNKTTSSFKVYSNYSSTNTRPAYWKASGYLAEGEY